MPVDMNELISLDRLKEYKGYENGGIAPNEATSTASKAYKTGARFYFQGKLCIATSDIAQGGTIILSPTASYNCKLDVLGDDVTKQSEQIDEVYGNLYNDAPMYLRLGAWENGSIDASGNLVNEQRKDYARTKDYFISDTAIDLVMTRKTALGSGSIVYLKYNPTTFALVSRTIFASADGATKEITIEANTPYKFFFTTPSGTVVDLNDTNTYATFVGKTLVDRIGYDQLTTQFKALFYELKDVFASIAFGNAVGMTATKSSNEISLTSSANSSYVSLAYSFLKDHDYLIYYSGIEGTLTGTGYYLEFRFMGGGITEIVGSATVKSDEQTSGYVIGTPSANTTLYLLLPNATGQTVTGDIYIYDVTGVSSAQIDSIDWSNVGSDKYIILNNGATNEWYGKKVVFYGDSITSTQYPNKVQEKLRFTLVKNAICGTRFGYASNQDSFSDDDRIEGVPSDADVVCIMGGTNDWQNTEIESTALSYDNGFDRTKFKGAVAYTVQKMQTQCPNAKIYLLTNIGGRGNEDPTVIQPLPEVAPSGAGAGNTPLKIRDAMIEVANDLNIHVIDTWSCGINGFNRGTYIRDTVHPNDAGQNLIAEYITSALLNNAPWD